MLGIDLNKHKNAESKFFEFTGSSRSSAVGHVYLRCSTGHTGKAGPGTLDGPYWTWTLCSPLDVEP